MLYGAELVYRFIPLGLAPDECHALLSRWTHFPSLFLKLQFPGNNKLPEVCCDQSGPRGGWSLLSAAAFCCTVVSAAKQSLASVGSLPASPPCSLQNLTRLPPAGFSQGCVCSGEHVSELWNGGCVCVCFVNFVPFDPLYKRKAGYFPAL